MNEARAWIAQQIGTAPAEIIFTGSASEANNLALKGLAFRNPLKPYHLVISSIEHDSVRHTARYLAERFDWMKLSEVPADSEGVIRPEAVERACGSGASLVSVMTVNNETGVRQPIEEIASVAHRGGALFHTDAVQAAGRLNIDTRSIGCDFLTLSAHKIYGPRGIGLLYAKAGTKIDPLVHGGHQEKGRRAGTENVEAIAGFAEALCLAQESVEEESSHLWEVESAFLDRLSELQVAFQINGREADKVAGIINLSVRGVNSADLVVGMDLAGFAISAGSACSSGVIEPSHVLKAMALEPWRVEGGVRISFGRSNSIEDVRAAADALSQLCARLNPQLSVLSGRPA